MFSGIFPRSAMEIIPHRQEYGEQTYILPYILLHERLHFPTVKIHKERIKNCQTYGNKALTSRE